MFKQNTAALPSFGTQRAAVRKHGHTLLYRIRSPCKAVGRNAITILKKIVPKSKTRELDRVPSQATSASSSSRCFESCFPQFTHSSLLKSSCFFQKKDPCISLAAQRPQNALLLCRAGSHRPACTAGLQHFARHLLPNRCLSSLLPSFGRSDVQVGKF